MSLDGHGRAIIPLQIKDRSYHIMFDNDSSIFPLLANDGKADFFTTAVGTGTIDISSWGTVHKAIGRNDEMITAKMLQSIYTEVENLPVQCKHIFKSIFY